MRSIPFFCYRVRVKRNYNAVFLFKFFFYSGGITRFQQLDNIRMDLKMDKAQILYIVFFTFFKTLYISRFKWIKWQKSEMLQHDVQLHCHLDSISPFCKEEKENAVGSHVPWALSVWGESSASMSQTGFGGPCLWLGTLDGCGLWKRLDDFTTLLLLVRWTSFTGRRNADLPHVPSRYIIHFILSDRLPQTHEKEMLSITNIWGEETLQMVNWYYCFICIYFLFEQNLF